jgi:hypothetical protein
MSVAEHLKLLAEVPRAAPQPEPPARPVASLARPPLPQKAPEILAASHQKVAFGVPTVKSPARRQRRKRKTPTETEPTDDAPAKEDM